MILSAGSEADQVTVGRARARSVKCLKIAGCSEKYSVLTGAGRIVAVTASDSARAIVRATLPSTIGLISEGPVASCDERPPSEFSILGVTRIAGSEKVILA